MAELSPTAARAAAPLRGLSASTLIAEALQAVGARWEAAFGLWAAGVAWRIGMRVIRLEEGSPRLTWSPAQLAQLLISAVVGAILAALTLSLFLKPGRDWWRPDRGFWTCVGLLTLASLGFSATGAPIFWRSHSEAITTTELRLGFTFAVQAGLMLIYARLMLWPVGALVGETGLAPARAWGLMRGQMVGFIVAVMVINLPLLLVTPVWILLSRISGHSQPVADLTWMWVATALIGPAVALLQRAMAAVIYRAKTVAA